MEAKFTKYFLYARKSEEDDERQSKSVEDQIFEAHEHPKKIGITITSIFTENKTAKKPGRKVFNEMIKQVIKSKEPVVIVAWHPDRLARNSVDGGQIIYLIDIGKIKNLIFSDFPFIQAHTVYSCYRSHSDKQNIFLIIYLPISNVEIVIK